MRILQLELYKADYEAERNMKLSLKAEKEKVEEDLGHLQRRNQQFLEEVEYLREKENKLLSRNKHGSSHSSAPSAPISQAPLCVSIF